MAFSSDFVRALMMCLDTSPPLDDVFRYLSSSALVYINGFFDWFSAETDIWKILPSLITFVNSVLGFRTCCYSNGVVQSF